MKAQTRISYSKTIFKNHKVAFLLILPFAIYLFVKDFFVYLTLFPKWVQHERQFGRSKKYDAEYLQSKIDMVSKTWGGIDAEKWIDECRGRE